MVYTLLVKKSNISILNRIVRLLYDKKAVNIMAIDVSAVSTLTDCFLIAEGNVERHVTALAHAVIDQESALENRPYAVEGLKVGEWVVIDFGELIIHLFHPDMREKYQFESIWRSGKIVDFEKGNA